MFEKYRKLNLDGKLISLEWQEEIYPYFCYPRNAIPIGFEGCIMYCFIEGYDEWVFASNPETCTDIHVYPLARNFKDFLRLIISCGSANPIEQIIWMNKEQFLQHVKEEERIRTEQQKDVLKLLSDIFHLSSMENPYEYVKAVQKEWDTSKIQYSDEYYDVLGLENPNGSKPHLLEFEEVVFKVKK